MRLFSIAPHTPFLQCLAGAVMDGRLLHDWDRSGPFWLSDVTIVVPTQRARALLADCFAAHPDYAGLLPDIRTFGGDDAEEEPFLPPYDAPPMPQGVTGLERRLVMSRLVAAWAHSPAGIQAFSTPPTAAEIFSMSDSLGTVIDDLQIEEKSASDLYAIKDGMEHEVSNYWQQTLEFLNIALTLWPHHLGPGRADPQEIRRQRLDRQALASTLVYADRPVIAAGSTGSIAATARLLAAIGSLPRGAVVLPGLDMDMSPQMHEALLNPDSNPHGHPQYGLARLLRRLGAGVGDVVELCAVDHPRTSIVNHALALTEDTALWSSLRPDDDIIAAAFDTVSVIRARTEDEEARSVALASRAALAANKTVGIITPDRNLARRIAAELRRFDIEVDDAAGAPLFQSPAGRLSRQVLSLVTGQCAPVDLVALLRNRSALFGLERADITIFADIVDLKILRGQRLAPGVAGLRKAVEKQTGQDVPGGRRISEDAAEKLLGFFDKLEKAISGLNALSAKPEIGAGQLAAALFAAVTAVSQGAPLHGRDELARWAADMEKLAEEGHRFAPRGLDAVLSALMTGYQVRNREARRSDISIWGQIEARLMAPDLVILAGLNEDKWPAAADPGPWLSRGMRLAAGMEPPERMQGLAAHDFAQAMGRDAVIISYSDRVGSSPALPSRLVQRLDAFIGASAVETMRERGQFWIAQSRAIDAVTSVSPAKRPLPNPPIVPRTQKLSVTEIETLMRSPYDIYAKHVLKLRQLDPLGEEPDARERGTIIHAIFARFVQEGFEVSAPDALETLNRLAAEEFANLDAIGERRDIWLRRFATAAEQFLSFERQRDPLVRKRHAEIEGQLELKLAYDFLITGKADRVDELYDGTLEMLDFKTGSPPSGAAMKAYEAPQLLLEAEMGANGGMRGVASADTSALTYIKIGLGPDAFKVSGFSLPPNTSLMEAADEINRRMQSHIEHFLLAETPLPARLMPLKTQRFAGTYDHLARVAEWTAVDGEDEA
ncbi:double-strand break repair protein AddB [Devosia sp. MC521]|uniref:double-strand break repair protein AddB n=1 Tax=Devosia sp. MC521 TaxID=2759954 RepID=UPI0015F807FB|nr:double-strand break repair protein AddB [Devosia sp. MC521]MBJ6987105.1 double-strand break repair protein AddB [Devosia sp. MC521]QMW62724.1 double-strand break repair protein AddB [Devosia sp. MC521]